MSISKGYRRLIIGYQNDCHEKIIKDFIRKKQIGGILVNRKNLDSSEKLDFIKECHRISDEKLFVFIDQEGGKVQRYFGEYGIFPSAKEVAEMSEQRASEIYGIMAEELRQIGVNINCAPVVDLNVNPDCPVIGKIGRSYGDSVNEVNKYASICVKQHNLNGIKCVYKHFPGHGSSEHDSHLGFTDVTVTWNERELLPYKYAIDNDFAEIIMTAHVFNRNMDSKLPFSLSLSVKELLRKKMGFNKLIITDDLDMKSISDFYSLDDIFDLTTYNTTDFILFSNYLKFNYELPAMYDEFLNKNIINKNKVELLEKSIMRIENIG